jgi:O-antigen ligase/polysaccharide polymerase Wzy-like membrane protein
MEKLTLVASLAFLAITSLITHVSHQGWFGFLMAPVPLLFYRPDGFRMMLLAFAGYLVFYQVASPGSDFIFFSTPDSIVIAYVALALFYSPNLSAFSLPMSAGLVPVYAFTLYGLALSIVPILVYRLDYFVMRDVKCLMFLALVPLLCRKDEPLFDPKNLVRMLLAIVFLTTVHSATLLAGFFATGIRPLTWNEIYLADAVLIIPILLTLNPEKRIRTLLYFCLPICLVGLLATQTRGLWLSSLISFILYAGVRIAKARTIKVGAILKSAQAILGLLLLAEIILRLSVGTGLIDFVQTRLMAHSNNEFINPYSSLGYRIHESLVVWEKRTWFGHGSGARLYLFFTQMGLSKFINWWAIHSEYFEILHKYGFVGLGIFMAFILTLMWRAFRMAMRGKAFPSALGFLVFTTLVNHCLVSITSGYLIRENVVIYLVMLIGIVERYYPRVFPAASAHSLPEPAVAKAEESA